VVVVVVEKAFVIMSVAGPLSVAKSEKWLLEDILCLCQDIYGRGNKGLWGFKAPEDRWCCCCCGCVAVLGGDCSECN
jgi:hypothetical protein